MKSEAVRYIVVHCSDTPPDMDIGVDEIRRWHVEDNGWDDVGYHVVITRKGFVEPGRSLDVSADPGWQPAQGAHARGHNHESVALCLVGGKGTAGVSGFSKGQMAALSQLLGMWVKQFPNAEVVGHYNLDPGKRCPTFNVRAWWRIEQRGHL